LRLDSSGSPKSKLGVTLDAIILFANKHDTQIGMHELRPQRALQWRHRAWSIRDPDWPT
jgi:LysR family transcriptional regulator, glycine cleavage system transcriptional activator